MTTLPRLSPAEQRILGALLEKERTVPASYPLSLNGLRTACNQTSSREPVTDYDERLVETTARDLKERGLVRIVWSDTGRRTLKYVQVLSELLSLAEDERAVLTVLLLRGPQAAGELKARTDRLHPFNDRAEVETTLRGMAGRDVPLVQERARSAGERDTRWVHLLGDQAAAAGEAPANPTELRDAGERALAVRASYAAIAGAYADEVHDVLAHQPFERWLLSRVAVTAMEAGRPVVEVGTGPGHVAAYLHRAGVEVIGQDVVSEMVEQARQRYPDVDFEVADLARLMRPAGHDGWSAVVAWHSLIHFDADELATVVEALVRPLRPGGVLVVAAHVGPQSGPVQEPGQQHLGTWFDQDVDLDFFFHPVQGWVDLFRSSGLTAVESYLRGPLDGHGESTQRVFLWGVKG